MENKFFFSILLILSVSVINLFGQAESAGESVKENPKSISAGVVNGKALNLPKPAYPAAAKAVRAQGAVNVQVIIDEEGNVISATAVSGHPLLRSAAVSAAREAKFSPTKLEGRPVRVTGVIVYNFTLPKEEVKENKTEVLLPLTLVMFMNALKVIPPDEEAKDILRGIARTLPASYQVSKAQFERLAKAESEERAQIIDDITATMRKNSSATETWAIDVGKYWGNAIGQALKLTENDFNTETKSFANSLQSLNWLLESPPAEISPEMLKRIRTIAAYNGEVDTVSPEFVKDFIKASIDFLEYIIKENERNS